MVTLIKVFAILFFILPALISANACQVSIVSGLTQTEELFDTYKTAIINLGDVTVTNLILTASDEVLSVAGLEAVDGGYVLSKDASIEVDDLYTFTYTVDSGKTVTWSEKCGSVAERSPHKSTSTTTTRKPSTTTTTKKPSTTTSTKKPATSTAAPQKSTTTKKPAATTTTKAPSTSTASPSKGTTTTTQSASSPSATGRVCPANTWWAPAPSTTWQWQLTGTIDTSIDVQMYDIDLFDNTAATISTLHSEGRVVICYFSTQYEDWRPDASDFTAAVLGNGLDGWTGENYVDIRSTVVRNIMTARMDLAVTKGCDGLEPDNVDGYTADTGFPLTAADQLNFNEFIATEAHARFLSVGLKNDVDQAKTLQPYFDWALDEQCYEYDECNTLSSFITNNKAVFNCEYSGSAATVCPYMVGLQYSSLIKTLDLTATIKAECCTYASGGCATVAAHTCISAEPTAASLVADNAPMLETRHVENEFVASATTVYTSGVLLAVAAAFVALNF